jgi:AP2-associated kinase
MAASFLREKSVLGIASITKTVSSHAGPREEIRIAGLTVGVKQRLAEGGFGFVDLVSDIHTHREYVLKRCSLQRKESLDIVQKEINLIQKFAGDYVIKLFGSEITGRQTSTPEALLLLEFCPGGHLLDRLKSRNGQKLGQEEVCRIFGMLLQGVLALHSCDPVVVHRDLKLENVLFGAV